MTSVKYVGSALDVTPEMLSTLSPHEQKLFVAAAERLVGGERVREFVERITPHEPVPNHLNPIFDVLEYARVKPIRVCLDYGPGHAKTTALTKGMAHWLQEDNSPADLCAYVTYSDEAAREKSAIAREYYRNGSGLKTIGGDGFWRTRHGGGLIARGAHGGLTGKRIPGILIYDDPYKDVDDARSPAINKKVIERFKSVAFTRLQGGSIIVLHTRWMMDDLIGWILRHLKWDSISVPSICDTVDPATNRDFLGRSLGEAAWPEKYPVEICTGVCAHDGHLNEQKKVLGDWLFSAMYQGKPRPEGIQVFHEPHRYEKPKAGTPERVAFMNGKRGVIVIDPAATAKTSSDWSVLLVCLTSGFGINTTMWIWDCVRVQVEIPKLVSLAKALQQRYRLMVACEAVGGFKAVPQMLRATDPSLRVVDVEVGSRDKFTRAQNAAAAWNDGRILVPINEPWVDAYVEEHVRFVGAGDAHDDQVDATSHGWNILYRPAPRVTESDYADSAV